MDVKRLKEIVAEPEVPQDWDILNVELSIEQRQALEQEYAELYERLKMDAKRLKEIAAEPEEPEFTFPQGMDILDVKLPIEQQQIILKEICGAIYDEYGHGFYDNNKNMQYDLTTIGGNIIFAMDRAHELGYKKCQLDLRNVLGINNETNEF